MRPRILTVTVLVSATLITLTGCSVPTYGLVGFTRDSTGTVVAVIQMCDGHVDGVTVLAGNGTDTIEVVSVALAEPVNDFTTVDLGPDFESKMTDVSAASSHAWSDDNSTRASGPELSPQNLSALRAGQILSFDPAQPESESTAEGNGLFDLAGFKEAAATLCT